MNPAIAASNPLQGGREQATAAHALERRAALSRALLFIPLMAAAAWAVTIGVFWLAWHILWSLLS